MSVTLRELIVMAVNRYGVDGYGAEDSVWNRNLMADLANEAHEHLARRARCYWEERTDNVRGGDPTIKPRPDVYEIEAKTVRFLSGDGTWKNLDERPYNELTAYYGPVENAAQGDPYAYYQRTGDAVSQNRVLVMFPTPTSDSLLRYSAFVYPQKLVQDTDEIPLPDGEARLLIPGVCKLMAKTELGRGRRDAPFAFWDEAEKEAIKTLRQLTERYRNPGPRQVRIAAYDPPDLW